MKPKDFLQHGVYYSSEGQMIFTKDNKHILDLRGWGAIQHLPVDDPEAFQDAIGEFIAQAINEKVNRTKLTLELLAEELK